MKKIQESIEIKGAVNHVFAALADPVMQMQFDGEMMRSCEKLTAGPIGKGTRFRGAFKGMGTVEYEYSDFAQNSLIEHSFGLPFGSARHRFEFEATGNGTRLTQSISVELNIFGKIMWPIMIKNMMAGRLHTLNNLVKGYIEKANIPASPSPAL